MCVGLLGWRVGPSRHAVRVGVVVLWHVRVSVLSVWRAGVRFGAGVWERVGLWYVSRFVRSFHTLRSANEGCGLSRNVARAARGDDGLPAGL